MHNVKLLVAALLALSALACGSCAAPRLPPIDPGPSPPPTPPGLDEIPPSPPARREIGQLPEGEEPGQDQEVVIEARGFQDAADVFRAHEVLATIPGVHLARHEGTSLEHGAPAGTYRLYFHGDPRELAARVPEVRWQSGAKSVRLKLEEGFRFQAVYE
jgi:hypothetical protein